MSTYECARCDAETDALPADWQPFESPVIGTLHLCTACAKAAERPARQSHNSGEAPSFSADDVITGAAQSRLRTIIERVERLEEDKAGISPGADLETHHYAPVFRALASYGQRLLSEAPAVDRTGRRLRA